MQGYSSFRDRPSTPQHMSYTVQTTRMLLMAKLLRHAQGAEGQQAQSGGATPEDPAGKRGLKTGHAALKTNTLHKSSKQLLHNSHKVPVAECRCKLWHKTR